MSAASILAVSAPNILGMALDQWSQRWYAIVAALLVPVILLRIADGRLRAAD